MCSVGIRLENTNPPHFFCDRNASSFSTGSSKELSCSGVRLRRRALVTMTRRRGRCAFRLDDRAQLSLIRRSCARSTGLCASRNYPSAEAGYAPKKKKKKKKKKKNASPYPRPARRSSPAAGLSLDRTGNGRPSQTRDLVKRWGRPRVVPFPKQKYWQAKLAGVKVGRSSIASPTNTSACFPAWESPLPI